VLGGCGIQGLSRIEPKVLKFLGQTHASVQEWKYVGPEHERHAETMMKMEEVQETWVTHVMWLVALIVASSLKQTEGWGTCAFQLQEQGRLTNARVKCS
jgi:hypothetical protein